MSDYDSACLPASAKMDDGICTRHNTAGLRDDHMKCREGFEKEVFAELSQFSSCKWSSSRFRALNGRMMLHSRLALD